MKEFSREEITFMAKLVPVLFDASNGTGWVKDEAEPELWREWSPHTDWRDLGPLYLACMEFCSSYPMSHVIRNHYTDTNVMAEGGDFDQFAEAVCNLAIEIGRNQ
jgi:hypothetical protein